MEKVHRQIKKIIIHCSATKEGKNFKAADIDLWHKQRGFNKIGYHYVIGLDGLVERGRGLDEVGAHAQGHNYDSIGICYIIFLTKPLDTYQTGDRVISSHHILNKVYKFVERQYKVALTYFYMIVWQSASGEEMLHCEIARL
ncbi:N-acetylmuramoyl-L-alanine amidase [Helicobacter vulpis]|uniref:N-acetylmuramoyl-L-alanine amidase n=1 Tax=Helicobacter vulpis TaxID=2316076 RepID=UPI000EB28D0E|nr:N-acetylmuramoyl-L-alanine amidase [Helicobacter vulpis]